LGCCQGLYANTFETIEELDKAITDFSTKLSSYNPEALLEMKKSTLGRNATLGHSFVTTRRYFGKLAI
jgi:hypothetical protein